MGSRAAARSRRRRARRPAGAPARPQAEVDDLHHRLAMTRWAAEQPPGADDAAYGVPLSRLRRLVSKWEKFDWRRWEDRLNAHPQFRTSIDGQPVHFLH